jgi:hypothetical protein
VLLVLLYTDQKDLESTNEDLRQRLDQANQERRDAQTTAATLAELATGESQDPPDAVRSKLQEVGGRIVEDQLVADPLAYQDASFDQALNQLYEAYRVQAERLAAIQEGNDQLVAQVEELTAANTRQKTEFDDQITALTGELEELKTSWEGYARQRDQEIDSFDGKLAELDSRYSRDIQEQREETKRVRAEFDELQNRYGELKERLGQLQIRPQALITARQSDGRVVTAKPGEEVVYVDLGRDAGLVLGLQFAVYPAASGIPADGLAKARIEVVNIFDRSAECRIVEVHGREPILEGDLVANPVFDRDRPLHFVVIGRFDIDGDGNIDAEGDRQIESLIVNWGGVVVEDVSAAVDFVVAGASPPAPALVGDRTAEAEARLQALRQRFEAYSSTLRTAQALSIPILTQDVFLHFLGYAY